MLFTFLERVLARLAGRPQGLLSLWDAAGSSLDPDGATASGDGRGSLDPNG